ncbi:hypothetical protein LV75_004212 [Actinokineospora diospyrosa]|uniref:Uncharacterized protein n=1 Tax=Actinokineospora diospyrosa TaxID=103728 RepID=A0ABT1IGK3_9PSEU|nr:hypothetical protein [Actinokineospora diospyrosa]
MTGLARHPSDFIAFRIALRGAAGEVLEVAKIKPRPVGPRIKNTNGTPNAWGLEWPSVDSSGRSPHGAGSVGSFDRASADDLGYWAGFGVSFAAEPVTQFSGYCVQRWPASGFGV